MLKPLYTAAVTDREAPSPWVECDGCGTAAALPLLNLKTELCPVCAAREVLRDTARDALSQMIAPHLGAWGNYWISAGLTLDELLEVVELLTAGWAHSEYRARYQAASLYKAMRKNPAPLMVERANPDRVEVNALTLPRVSAAYKHDRTAAAPEPGEPDRRWAFSLIHPDGSTSEGVSVHAGPDVLLMYLSGPEGDAVLYYLGIYGKTGHRPVNDGPLYIPAQFVKYVRDALGHCAESRAGGAQ